jgi:hypothetical protein
MMLVKGSALASMRTHIPKKVGKSDFDNWLRSLKPEVEKVFSSAISTSQWYPISEYLIEPTQSYCKLFYGGDLAGAWELGRFNADYSLSGIYKIFIEISNIKFIMSRVTKILPSYYKPSNIELIEVKKNSCVIRITEFPDIHEVIEYRVGGWIEYALEMHGVTDINVQIVKSLTRKDSYTEYQISYKEK